MASDEAPVPAMERPGWWKIGWATLAGVVGGAFAFLVLQWPLALLLDQFLGRSEWQTRPLPLRLVMLTLYWTIPLALGQFLSAFMSGWAKAVYFAAALQTLHLLNIYADFAFALLWFLPSVIASAMIMVKWAAVGAEKGRALEAKRITVRSKG